MRIWYTTWHNNGSFSKKQFLKIIWIHWFWIIYLFQISTSKYLCHNVSDTSERLPLERSIRHKSLKVFQFQNYLAWVIFFPPVIKVKLKSYFFLSDEDILYKAISWFLTSLLVFEWKISGELSLCGVFRISVCRQFWKTTWRW